MTQNPIRGNVDFMKDWPFWGWIAYGCLAIAAYGMAFWTFVERHPTLIDWFPASLRSYLLGYVPATLVSIGTIILIIQWIKGKRPAGVETSTVVSMSSPIVAKPKKFYSERNKNDLSNALTDLLEILNKYGFAITDKSNYIVNILQMPADRISPQDITNLIRELEEMQDLSNKFYQGIHGGKGILKTYATYHDDLSPIVEVNLIIYDNKQIYDHPKRLVDANINYFINELKTIQLAIKHDDQNLINLMIANSKRNIPNYTNAIKRFNEWLKEIQNRIVIFRNFELNVN